MMLRCTPLLVLLGCCVLAASANFNFMYPSHEEMLARFRGFGRRLIFRQDKPSFQCQGEGFFADPNDCSKFYRCVNYGGSYGLTAFEFRCGEGTVFDESIIACNHPWAVSGPCGASQVASETQTSMEQEHPNPAEGGRPPPPSNPEPPPEETEDYDYQSPPDSPSNPEPPPSAPEPPPGSENEIEDSNSANRPKCTMEGYFTDPNDCSKFYRCVAVDDTFDVYRFQCGPQTVFDEKNLVCSHPRDVMGPCGVTEAAAEAEMGGAPQGGEDSQPNNNNNENNNNSNEGTSSESSSEMASQEQTTEHSGSSSATPPAENSEEGQLENENTPPPPGSSETTDGSSENTNSTDCCKNCKPAVNGTCQEEGFFPVENDCRKFYRCVSNGKDGSFSKYDFECGEGTVFDPSNNVCNHASVVDRDCSQATGGNDQGSTTTEGSSIGSSSTETVTETTVGGGGGDDSTTSSGSSTDTGTQTSAGGESSTESSSTSESSSSSSQSEGTTSSTNTEVFTETSVVTTTQVQGENQVSESTTSSSSSSESSSQSTSETSESSTDGSSSSSTESSSSQSTESSTSQSSESTTGQSTDGGVVTDGPIVTDSPHENDKGTEECTAEGYYPNKSDCKKFYRCVDNGKGGYTKYEFDCAEGTLFDAELGICNHAHEVNCNGSPMPEDPQPETTTAFQPDTTTVPSGESTEMAGQPETTTTWQPDGTQEPHFPTTSVPDDDDDTSTPPVAPPCMPIDPKPEIVNCTEQGYYADTTDCRNFYHCIHWANKTSFNVYFLRCPEGNIFDPERNVCDYPEKVNRECAPVPTDVPHPPEPTETPGPDTTIAPGSSQPPTSGTSSTDSPGPETTTQELPGTTKSPEDPTGTTEPPTTINTGTPETEQPPTTGPSTGGTEPGTTEPPAPGSTEAPPAGSTEPPAPIGSTEQPPTTTEPAPTGTDQPPSGGTEPPAGTDQPPSGSTEPPTGTDEPPSGSTEPPTGTDQPPSGSTEPPTGTDQPPSGSTEPPAGTDQPPSGSTEPPTGTDQPPTGGTEPPGTDQPPAGTTEPPPDGTKQPGTGEPPIGTTEPPSDSTAPPTTMQPEPQPCRQCCDLKEGEYSYICPTKGFKQHPKYCNYFYQCMEVDDGSLKITSMRCELEGSYFDPQENQCVDRGSVQCNIKESNTNSTTSGKLRAKNARLPIGVGSRALCPNTGFYPYEKDCRHFFHCKQDDDGSLYGQLKRCPEGFTFWEVSRRCELERRVARSCNGRNENVMAWDIPVDFGNVGRLSKQLLHML